MTCVFAGHRTVHVYGILDILHMSMQYHYMHGITLYCIVLLCVQVYIEEVCLLLLSHFVILTRGNFPPVALLCRARIKPTRTKPKENNGKYQKMRKVFFLLYFGDGDSGHPINRSAYTHDLILIHFTAFYASGISVFMRISYICAFRLYVRCACIFFFDYMLLLLCCPKVSGSRQYTLTQCHRSAVTNY